MSEVFSCYEHDFEKYHISLCSLIRGVQISKQYEQMNEISQTLREMQNCLQQMDVESTSVAASDRQELKNKVRKYKSDVETLNKQIRILEDEAQSQKQKDSLFGEQENQQIQFIKTQDKLIQQTLQLQEAKRTCFEVEQVANNIQLNLSLQTELIKNNIDKTQGIEYELGESNSTLTRIRQKMREHKVVFLIVLTIFLTGISIVLAYKFS